MVAAAWQPRTPFILLTMSGLEEEGAGGGNKINCSRFAFPKGGIVADRVGRWGALAGQPNEYMYCRSTHRAVHIYSGQL